MQVQMKMIGICMKYNFFILSYFVYSDEEGEHTHRGSSHKSVVKSVWFESFLLKYI